MSCSLCNYWNVKIQWIEMISPPHQINLSENQIETVLLPRSVWAARATAHVQDRGGDFWQVIPGGASRFGEASVLIPLVML